MNYKMLKSELPSLNLLSTDAPVSIPETILISRKNNSQLKLKLNSLLHPNLTLQWIKCYKNKKLRPNKQKDQWASQKRSKSPLHRRFFPNTQLTLTKHQNNMQFKPQKSLHLERQTTQWMSI